MKNFSVGLHCRGLGGLRHHECWAHASKSIKEIIYGGGGGGDFLANNRETAVGGKIFLHALMCNYIGGETGSLP